MSKVNNNSHRAFLIVEMQMQSEQANRIRKQLALALAENDVKSICISAVELRNNLHNEKHRIVAVGFTKDNLLKCNRLQLQLDSLDTEWIDADEFAYDEFDWTELMYNTLEAIEPGIMD